MYNFDKICAVFNRKYLHVPLVGNQPPKCKKLTYVSFMNITDKNNFCLFYSNRIANTERGANFHFMLKGG